MKNNVRKSHFRKSVPSILVAGAVAVFGGALGCGGDGLSLPIEVESEPYNVNVDEHVGDFEINACADEDSQNCRVIRALDMSDDGAVSDPPSIPTEFPLKLMSKSATPTTTASPPPSTSAIGSMPTGWASTLPIS